MLLNVSFALVLRFAKGWRHVVLQRLKGTLRESAQAPGDGFPVWTMSAQADGLPRVWCKKKNEWIL